MVQLQTRPEPIVVDPKSAAVVIVDMQNAFASKGGLFDLAGIDVSKAARIAKVLRRTLQSAREAGMKVLYLQMGYRKDLSDAGGPDSPNQRRELALAMGRGQCLTEGTWDFSIIDALKPRPEDLVVVKSRYSGFARTKLHPLLRARKIRFLFFTGIATNVCVESTLRDAFFLDYWPILIRDATLQAGPSYLKRATIHNVETHFGWTLTSEELVQAFASSGL